MVSSCSAPGTQTYSSYFEYPSLVILTETVRIKCALEKNLPTDKQTLGLSALDADGFRQNDKAWC